MKKSHKFLATLLSAVISVSSAGTVSALSPSVPSEIFNSIDAEVLEMFLENVISRSVEMIRSITGDMELAYSNFVHHHSDIDFYVEGGVMHITSEMLEEERGRSEEEFNRSVDTLSWIREIFMRRDLEIPENETRDQLNALHVYMESMLLARERREYISRDFLISVLSMANYSFGERTRPTEFDVDDVCIKYMNGKMTITCYYNGHRTYRAVIGHH